jgi:hypothetical protein
VLSRHGAKMNLRSKNSGCVELGSGEQMVTISLFERTYARPLCLAKVVVGLCGCHRVLRALGSR